MLRDNKFISIISIAGTALAIAMIMVIIVTEEIKTVNAGPEPQRSRTLYIYTETRVKKVDNPKDRRALMGNVSYDAFRKIKKISTPEYVSVTGGGSRDHYSILEVCAEGSDNYYPAFVKTVDDVFWKIMSFQFIDGRPFSAEEYESGVRCAVINRSLSQKIFKGEQVIGKTIIAYDNLYKIIGIVEDVAPIFKYADGDIWIPVTSRKDYDAWWGYQLMIVAKSKNDFPAIRDEIKECEKQLEMELDSWQPFWAVMTIGQPDIKGHNEEEVNNLLNKWRRSYWFIFALLLFIPALNLSGFSMSRIKKRTTEIGIRKAFGARKSVILIQVLYENLITSLIGGFIGLFFSYLLVAWLRSWLLGIPADGTIPVSSYLSWQVLVLVTVVCIALNLLSAGLPAWRASRMAIIESINQKR